MKKFKQIINIIFFLLFIIICLILLGGSCSAESFTYTGVEGSGFSSTDVNDIETCFNNVRGNSTYFVLSCKAGERAKMCVFDTYNPPKFFVDLVGNSRILSSTSFNFRLYWLNGGGSTTYIGTYNNTSLDFQMPFTYSNSLPMVYGNVPMYDDNSFTAGFWSPFIPASILNFSNQTYISNLVNGSFDSIIVNAGDFARYPVRFHMNNGSTGLDTEKSISILLDHNSPYADTSIEPNQYQSWTIPKADLIPIYNNSIYNFWLEYGENFSLSTSVQTFQTDFSQSTIDNAIVDTQDATQQIANEMTQTNNFLSSDSVDDNDFELPEVSVNDITGSFFTTLIGGFVNVFANVSANETLTINYRGETYVVNSSDFNFLNAAGFSALKTLISLAWVFGFGYWVLCDLRFRIQRLQTFGWTSMFADDIVEKIL